MLLSIVWVVLGLTAPEAPPAASADLVLLSAKIWTGDPARHDSSQLRNTFYCRGGLSGLQIEKR
jgi:hypothetical protein